MLKHLPLTRFVNTRCTATPDVSQVSSSVSMYWNLFGRTLVCTVHIKLILNWNIWLKGESFVMQMHFKCNKYEKQT